MADEAHDISWEGLAESLSAEGLTAYLLDSRTANDAIEQFARETGLPPLLVRPAFKGLACLIAARGNALLRWSSGTLQRRALEALQQTRGGEALKQFIWRWSRTLRDDAARREALDAILNGSTAQVDPNLAKGFSESTRLALRSLETMDKLDAGQQEILGDLSNIQIQLETIRQTLDRQPPLDGKMLDRDQANRLTFGARRVPFVGRDDEMAKLNAFLNADADDGNAAPFRWWLALGAGGLGKSRLAFEFCLQAGLHWQTGFLTSADTQFDWDKWQPEQPTLIIIDYAGTRPERTGDILRSLARRAATDKLAAPVRVLLLERNRDDLWWNRMRGAGGEAYAMDVWRHATQDLELLPLDDDAAWSIVETILAERSTQIPNRTETLARIREIDPALRPLFVTLASESLAERQDLRGWDRERLLQDVLERDKQKFWPKNIDTAPYANLLCLATMVGGLDVKTLKHAPEGIALPAFEPFESKHHRAMARAVSEPENGDMLPPLFPDIVGEYFVLQHFKEPGTPAQQEDRIVKFRDAAWGMEGVDLRSLWSHLDRQMQDFPDDVPLALLNPPQVDSAAVRWLWGVFAVNAIFRLADTERSDARYTILGRIYHNASSHPDQQELLLLWAQGATNMIASLAKSEGRTSKGARKLFTELLHVRDTHSEDAAIQLAFAKGTFNFLTAHTKPNEVEYKKALYLLKCLENTADACPEGPEAVEIRLKWAQGTFNLITGLAVSSENGTENALTRKIHGGLADVAQAVEIA